LALAAPAHALTITPVSGSNLEIDIDDDPALSLVGGYEGYRITTLAGESYDDLWVRSTEFDDSALIQLAPNEDGVRHLGPLGPSSSIYVYFYLNASAEQTTPESHDIQVFDGPITGTAIATQDVALTATESAASADSSITVITHTPGDLGIGGTLVMTVLGTTGTTTGASPNVFISPATRGDWPAHVFELEHVISRFDHLPPFDYVAGTYTNEHELSFATGDSASVEYEVVYTFRIVGAASVPTDVQPMSYLSSGGPMTHAAIDGVEYIDALDLAGAIPAPALRLVLTREPQSSDDVQLEASGGTVVHRLRVTNAHTQDVVIDDIRDLFVSPHATPSYVAASSTLTTFDPGDPPLVPASTLVEASVEPVVTITTTDPPPPLVTTAIAWTFTDHFTIPAGGYIELEYTASYPDDDGTYLQRGTAHVGTTQIDTTIPATVATPADDAPAIVLVSVGADGDGDGIGDPIDRDSDGDGIDDLVESGLVADPDADADSDGVPNMRDPSFVDCSDTTPSDGVCDALPAALDVDSDGIANHFDLDSDEDGISDHDEAFDADGDGVGDVSAANADTDADGIDDAFDVDCALAADCGGVLGAAVAEPFSSAQDENGDSIADWLQQCGDAYVTSGEACDDGNLEPADACSDACLRGADASCANGTQCASNLCDTALGSCQACIDDVTLAVDSGCSAAAPSCAGGECFECLTNDDCSAGQSCSSSNSCEDVRCASDADCAGIEGAPACDATSGACVSCTTETGCAGNAMCNENHACVHGDHDSDGVTDEDDEDDDGDGVPDDVEIDSEANRDDDGDGVLDFEDPSFVDCADEDDEVCDALPEAFDLDADGYANHVDADADGDQLLDRDEAHDDDFDGEPDRTSAQRDSDGDGLDDAFDADCASAARCGGVIGVASNQPDLDDDGAPNYFDADDDGDERSTHDEVVDAAAYEGPADDPTDIDEDGHPNWLDADSDGDGADDAAENERSDVDENGIRDALDPLFRAQDDDGDGLLDVVECPPPASPVDDECPDTDDDGTPDYQDLDSDSDGLADADEHKYFADRLRRDTDGDRLSDGDEVRRYGTDPTRADTDGDGFSDGQEIEDGTNPLTPPGQYSLQGGSFFGCTATGARASTASSTLAWLALGCVVFRYRRRRSANQPQLRGWKS
jgi:hypothetical protein